MSSAPGDAPHADGLDAERARIQRYYTESFLPANPWTTLKPRAYLYLRQRQRRLREALLACGVDTPEKIGNLEILDVGAGGGGNLAWLVELGANPARCTAIDIVPQRVEAARHRLPAARWLAGDITTTDVGGPFDLVLLIAVLTSVTNTELKRRIVERCFSLLRPGGIFFFYDVMARGKPRGNADYMELTYDELEGYLGGRKAHWFKRDYLRADLAERITPRLGIVAAELLQATRLFNMEGSFAHVRA